jgi:hypothetical protein
MINQVDEFVFYDDVQYTKNDWRNRNRIKTPQGVQWITLDVHWKSGQKIFEAQLASSNWASKHWKTLVSNYGKSEFFNAYKHSFEEFYLSTALMNLAEVNYALIKIINRVLNIKTSISFSQNFKLKGDRNERLIDLIKQIGGNEYLSGPAAKDYLDEKLFNSAGIQVSWMDYSGYPEYRQLFPPFAHDVSVIDLIFNEGPHATAFMKTFSL